MTTINGNCCMFNIATDARPKLIEGIIDRVKQAAEQLSKNRAGLVWIHLAGLPENQFRWLAQHAKERSDSPFNIVSNYILRRESRNHVAAIWYSASADSYENTKSFKGERMIQSAGPVYQAQSFKSKFSLPAGLARSV